MREQLVPSRLVAFATAPLLRSGFGLLVTRLAAWVRDCADRYAAAAAYEHLSRLSDAELEHRGLSRDILVRDLEDAPWSAKRHPRA
jgi:hypothetical protein